ncbi:ABC transporter substrate-binding protein (plasmid) [Arthrobacter sp. D3-18]
MILSLKLAMKGFVVLAAGALALTGCTNASEAAPGGSGNGSASGPAAFDSRTVAKDEALASQVPAVIKSKGTLLVASDTAYPPAEFLGGADNQTPMGYEMDIANALSATLGLKAEVQSAAFTAIIPALGPKYDLGISSFGITEERLEAVNFVSYFQAGIAWATKKGNPNNFSPENACGRKVGAASGSTLVTFAQAKSDACAAAGKDPVEIVLLDKMTDFQIRVTNGAVDAVIADSPVVGLLVDQSNGTMEKVGKISDVVPQGIAIAKDDPELAKLIHQAMNKLIADGTYKKILDTWNVADGAISTSELNPSVAE